MFDSEKHLRNEYRRFEATVSPDELAYANELMRALNEASDPRELDFSGMILDIELLRSGKGLKRRSYYKEDFDLSLGVENCGSFRDFRHLFSSRVISQKWIDAYAERINLDNPTRKEDILARLIWFQKSYFTHHADTQASMTHYIWGSMGVKIVELLLKEEQSGREYPLNCDARAKILISVLRRAFPQLKVFVDLVFQGQAHVRPVIQFPGEDTYYAIDGGVKVMNRPPSHLDAPELVYASWFIEEVLGESPFDLEQTTGSEDKEKISHAVMGKQKSVAQLVASLFHSKHATYTTDELIHQDHQCDSEVELTFFAPIDIVEHVVEEVELMPEETDKLLEAAKEIAEDLEEESYDLDLPSAPILFQRLKPLVGGGLALAAVFTWLNLAVSDYEEKMNAIELETTVEAMPERWVTFDPDAF